jgi:hypothetical protein
MTSRKSTTLMVSCGVEAALEVNIGLNRTMGSYADLSCGPGPEGGAIINFESVDILERYLIWCS